MDLSKRYSDNLESRSSALVHNGYRGTHENWSTMCTAAPFVIAPKWKDLWCPVKPKGMNRRWYSHAMDY